MEHRGRMNREDRAKQFMPFAALKGYPEALRKKEKIVVPKIELPEEYQEELDRKLRQIKKNDVVTAVFFLQRRISAEKRDGVPNRYIRQSDTDRQYENLY